MAAGSQVQTSAVARRAGRSWFAVAVDSRLRIYRWLDNSWVLDGAVAVPPDFPAPEVGAELGSTSITRGNAPGFVVNVGGADTEWLAIAARIRGRWLFVPFDDPFGSRHAYSFGVVDGHLVHGIVDGCGCADGPTTEQWYRFAGGVFVATSPPGPSAACSPKALAAASHYPRLPYDPLVRAATQPIRLVRFACADGWALATDGENVGVYEQRGHGWFRVGVGSAHLVGTRNDFDLPRSLLNRLGARIDVRFPPATEEPGFASPPPSVAARWRAPITVRIRPGDTYSSTVASHSTVLTVTIARFTAHRSVVRFRWRDGRWART
jgi:hypothetical protein